MKASIKCLGTTAVLACLALVTAMPATAQTLMELALESYNDQHYDMALNYITQELKEHPDNGAALAYKGSVLRKYGETSQAFDATNRAIELLDTSQDPTFGAWVYYQRAALYAELGDTTSAINDMGNAIALNGNDPDYYQDRAYLHYNQHNYAEAANDARRAAELDPEDTYNLEILARACKQQGKYDEAIEALTHAASLDPANADNWNRRAERLREQSKPTTDQDGDPKLELYVTASANGGTGDVRPPEFPGGQEGLKDYVCNNLVFPKQEADEGNSGQVVVNCLINENGQVTDCRVAKSASAAFDEEAVRVCRSLPRFTPATCQGKPVESWYRVTVTFTLYIPPCAILPQDRKK